MKKTTIRTILIVAFLLVTLYYLSPLFMEKPFSFWTDNKLKLGLDLRGGMQINLYVDLSKIPDKEKEEAVKTALEVVRNRIDQFGVAEPSIQRVGENKIVVQLPGLKDFSRAKDLIGKTALLEFKLVADQNEAQSIIDKLDMYLAQNINKYPYLSDLKEEPVKNDPLFKTKKDSTATDQTSDSGKYFTTIINSGSEPYTISADYLEDFNKMMADTSFTNNIPSGYQVLMGKEDKTGTTTDRQFYVLYDRAEVTGKYLSEARTTIGSQGDFKNANKPYITFKFNREGAKVFERITGANIQKRLAIVLDNVVYMAPTIQDRIRGGEGQITGQFTLEECQDLVIVLKAGNLPAPVEIGEERTIGPSLGSDSIHSGLKAGLIGALLVVLFMLIYYKLAGFIANIALALNVAFIFAVLTIFGGTLTLPGIAGIILTIGMAVDANVLIFERIREEIRNGKTPRNAVEAGFSRAMITIIDSNITTLITAAVLYQFGTGPIRGFALTLSIGIISSMFTAIIVTKAIFDGFVTNRNREKLSI